MGDTPLRPVPEPEPTVIAEYVERVNAGYRSVLTGQPDGRVRRKTLFLVASLSILVTIGIDGLAGIVIGGVALIAVLLLAMSDDLVDLS